MHEWKKTARLALLLAGASVARAEAPAKVFSHPDRVRYDGRCMTIDGRDVLILSGTFPYFRCPKPLWRDRFQKIVASGCNAVETYVPWNWHERNMPSSLEDYSQVDLTDLKDWLRMAHDEFGLYTIIRPGPYICAEWDGGGFPRWLLTKMPPSAKRRSGGSQDIQAAAGADAVGASRPGAGQAAASPATIWLRSDDPGFLAWSEHWLKAVCPVIAAEQVTRRPPGRGGVILFQIENEYDFYPEVPAAERVPHLRALYETALANGIEVPIFTCWTKQARGSSDPELGQVFDAFNCYPRYKIDATAQRIRDVQASQPDAPAMISELGGGWFSGVGGQLSEDQPGLTAEELNAHTLLAIQEGASILNYYVLFGGTNFGLWPGRGNTTTYDYFAPIREPGGVGDKYLAVKAIGLMLQQHGGALARSVKLDCQAETGSADVTVAARRARNGDLYLFFRNHKVDESRRGNAAVWVQGNGELQLDYALGPFGLKIYYLPIRETDPNRGQWLPKPVAGPPRPDGVPGPVRLSEAQSRSDPGGADWVPVPGDAMLPELGVYDARTVVYAASLGLAASQVTPDAKLLLDPYPGDTLAVEVNGHVVPCGLKSEAVVGPWLREGTNAITVLYDQEGQANIHRTIQDELGLRGAVLVSGGATLPVSPWKLARSLGGIAAGWPGLGAGLPAGWTVTALDTRGEVARKGGLAGVPEGTAGALATWYRMEFELPAPSPGVWVPWRALIDAAGDGEIFLNGNALGRFWEVGPQREYYLPECWLRFGAGEKNVLTLYLSPRQKGVALRAVEVAPYADQAELRN
jgi:hypothetical protein